MIKIGAVNIDTSHPMGFGEVLEKGNRARYVGVYNDSFRPETEVMGFMKRFGAEHLCSSLEELADLCDIGFIHSCDWDDHLRLAMPFIEKKKPVFIDKPIVGSLRDCEKIQKLADSGAVILGSSSARYAYEIQDFLKMPLDERGETVNVFGTSGVDEFNYGIHVVEIIGGLLGSGAVEVRYMGKSEADGKLCESYYIQFANGKSALYNTFTGTWQPFAITVMTTKTTWQIRIDSGRLYEALLDEICNYMEGKPNRLVPVTDLVESTKIMLAGAASRASGGAPVRLDRLKADGPGYDGKAFWTAYGNSAGSMYAAR